MTTISAKVIEHSVGVDAPPLPSVQMRYPRFIHAEVMTHRVFGRNARSSRAVPIERMIEEIMTDPVIPLHWGAAQKGMQAYEECDAPVMLPTNPPLRSFRYESREDAWLQARDQAVRFARAFHAAGYAKQIVNRLLEPFMHIDVLATATEWENFFALRDHHAAEPHIQMLARAVKDAIAASTPRLLLTPDWHLPYVTEEERHTLPLDVQKKLSIRRCARISYAPFAGDGTGSIEDDIAKAEQLATSGHWSPFEHQASPDRRLPTLFGRNNEWCDPASHGNLVGWRQLRKTYPGESGRRAA